MEQLNQHSKQTLSTLDRVPVSMLAFDAGTMNLVLANARFRDTFGYKANDIQDAAGWWKMAIPDAARRNEVVKEWKDRVEEALRDTTPAGPVEASARSSQGLDIPVRVRVGMHSGLIIITLEESSCPEAGTRTWCELPSIDPLTGFANKKAFLEDLEHGLSLASRHGHPIFLVAAGIDSLDQIAERYGTDARDALLRHYAAIVRHTLRTSDVAGRLGQEEFVFMLPETHRSGAFRFVERMRQALQDRKFAYKGDPIHYSVDYAVTGLRGEMPWRAPSREQFIRMAGKALSQARKQKLTLGVAEQYRA